MMRKGATFSPGDRYGTLKSGLQYRVRLLDGSDFIVEINKKSLGQMMFDQVLRRLEVLERDYFGLQFEDEQKTEQWLDLSKPAKKQLKRGCQLYFRVRFYPLDPMALRTSSRTQFYLQLRQDISKGRLFCSSHDAPSTLSYILQADLGDYENEERDTEYLTEQSLLSSQLQGLESEVAMYHESCRLFPSPVFDRLQYANTDREGLRDMVTCGDVRQRTCFVNTLASSLRTDITGKGFCEVLHRALPPVCLPDVTARNQISQAFPAYCKRRGMNPQEAIKKFLRQARELEFYGMHLFYIRYEDVQYQLGLSPMGVAILRGTRRSLYFEWSKILQVSYKSKKFIMKIQENPQGGGSSKGVSHLTFDLDSIRGCKELWRSFVDNIGFYSDPNRQIREDPHAERSPGAPVSSPQAGSFVFPSPHHLGQPTVRFRDSVFSESESSRSQESKEEKIHKAQSLPRRFPGQDPIAAALMHHRNGEGRYSGQFSGPNSPTSPDDFTSTSTASDSSPAEALRHSLLSGEEEREFFRSSDQEVSTVVVENGHYISHENGRASESQTRPAQHTSTGMVPSAVVPRKTSNEEGLSQDHEDMHDSLLDLADELGGSAESGEGESPRSDRRTTTTHGGRSHADRSSASSVGTSSVGTGRNSAEQDRSPQLARILHSSTLPSHPPHTNTPPPKPPRTMQTSFRPTSKPSPVPAGEGSGGQKDKKKQSRNLVRHWVQEQQLRSSSQQSLESSDSQERVPSRRSEATPSPLTTHKSTASGGRSSSSRMHGEGLSQSTRSDMSTNSLQRNRLSEHTHSPQRTWPPKTHATVEQVPAVGSEPQRDYPLPDSPPPPPYMSPSPDSEQALLLQQLTQQGHGQLQQREQPQHTIPATIDGPDLSSVDDIIMSQARNRELVTSTVHSSVSSSSPTRHGSQPHSYSPGQKKIIHSRPKSPELWREIEAVMTNRHSLDIESSSHTTGSLTPQKPSPENSRRPVSNILPASGVEASTEVRHQRRGMERHLHQSRKKINHVLKGERGNIPLQQDDIAVQQDDFPTGINPDDFTQEKIEIDPRNLINAPSPVYDRLVDTEPDTSEGELELHPATASGYQPGMAQAQPPLYTTPGTSRPAKQQLPTAGGIMPGDILHEVMAGDNLPPPPPHLVALSHELEGHAAVNYQEPRMFPPGPSHTTASVPSTGTGSPKKKVFDPKFFVRALEQERERPHAATDTSRYPPNIASFMTRVRNSSMDANSSDTGYSPDVMDQVVEVSERKESPRTDKHDATNLVPEPQPPPRVSSLSGSLQRSNEYERQPPETTLVSMPTYDTPRNAMGGLSNQQTSNIQTHKETSWPENGIPSHRYPNLTQSWDSSPRVATARAGKSISLPRGQSAGLSYYRHDSSRESTPSTANTQSDLPHGVTRHPPVSNPREHNHSDVRRAKTFNSGKPLHHLPSAPTQHSLDDDSIPNSPTYFTQHYPGRLEATPSPNTEAQNRSFQEHLNALEGHKRGRRSRVLDWMQRTSDAKKYQSSLPMIKDPGVNIPARPYERPSHLYQTAEEAFETEREERVPQQAQAVRASYPSYNYGGAHAQTQRQGYPSAKFGKDFYIIDV